MVTKMTIDIAPTALEGDVYSRIGDILRGVADQIESEDRELFIRDANNHIIAVCIMDTMFDMTVKNPDGLTSAHRRLRLDDLEPEIIHVPYIPRQWEYISQRCNAAGYDTCASLAREIDDMVCIAHDGEHTSEWVDEYISGNTTNHSISYLAREPLYSTIMLYNPTSSPAMYRMCEGTNAYDEFMCEIRFALFESRNRIHGRARDD